MIKIKDKELIFQTVILVNDNEEAFIEFPIENETLKIIIKFIPESKEHGIRWNLIDDIVKIDFSGLNTSLGSSIDNPIKLGTSDSKKSIGILFFHHKVGLVNRLDFHVLLGGEYD